MDGFADAAKAVTSPLLIVGASGRAAAASALRAGYSPYVIDLFADADTQRLAPTIRCPMEEYPHGLPALAERAPHGPWLYTGGIENHPDVIEAISAKRELFGFGVEVLRRMRDPLRLGEFAALLPNGRACEVRKGDDPPQVRGGWLKKPLRSSGGMGIRPALVSEPSYDDHYYQEFLVGESCSALFAGEQMIGLTMQLIAEQWLHAAPFRYCGSTVRRRHGDASNVLTWGQPVWGIDYIALKGHSYPIEVNPRYTAGMELLERPTKAEVVAKAVYFAPWDFRFPESGPWDESVRRAGDLNFLAPFADIPHPATEIKAGDPVLTLFGEGTSANGAVSSLMSRAAELDRLFTPRRTP